MNMRQNARKPNEVRRKIKVSNSCHVQVEKGAIIMQDGESLGKNVCTVEERSARSGSLGGERVTGMEKGASRVYVCVSNYLAAVSVVLFAVVGEVDADDDVGEL